MPLGRNKDKDKEESSKSVSDGSDLVKLKEVFTVEYRAAYRDTWQTVANVQKDTYDEALTYGQELLTLADFPAHFRIQKHYVVNTSKDVDAYTLDPSDN